MPSEHRLKTWECYFDAIARGDKTFEVRRDDRGFNRGDTLVLERWHVPFHRQDGIRSRDHNTAPIKRIVSYVLTGGQFGIEPGYVVMGLQEVTDEKPR